MLHPQATTLSLRCVAECLFGGLVVKEERPGFFSAVGVADYDAMEAWVQYITDLGECCELEVATKPIVVKVGVAGMDRDYYSVEGARFAFRQTYDGETDIIMELDLAKGEEVDRLLEGQEQGYKAVQSIEPVLTPPHIGKGLTSEPEDLSEDDDDDDWWL